MTVPVLARCIVPATALLMLLAAAPALGTDEGQQLRALVGELREKIQRAETERLADPWFLQELHALVRRYDWPWQVSVYQRDFVAEGLREIPSPWQVSAGRVAMDWNRGLRSSAEAPPEAAPGSASGEEIIGALVGGILDQALGGRQRQQQTPAAGPARYQLPIAIANAFALRITLSQRPPEGNAGRYAVGVYQGVPEGAGYRLDLNPGAAAGEAAFALLRLSGRGTAQTVEIYDGERRLHADQPQELLWTRDAQGVMVLSLDGEPLFQVQDRSLRGQWDGLTVINAAGDLAFSRIAIEAAP